MTQPLAIDEGTAELEPLVLESFRRTLGDESLEPSDDFFSAGGYSLLAVRVAGELTAALGAKVPVALIFMHSTPAELASAIAAIAPTGQVAGASSR